MSTIIIDTADELNNINAFLKKKKIDISIDPIYVSINSIKECILGYMLSKGMYNRTFSNAYNSVDLKLYSLIDLMHLNNESKDEDGPQEIDNLLSHIQFIIEPSIYDKLEKYLLYHLNRDREFGKIKIFNNGLTIINII